MAPAGRRAQEANVDDQTAPPNGQDATPADDQTAPPPGYAAPPPGYAAQPPGYAAPPPGYAPPPPGYAAPPPGYGQYPYQPQAPGHGLYPGQAPPRHHGLPWWAIVLIVVAVLVPVVGIGSAIAIPTFLNQHDRANDSAVKEGVHSIQVGIQSYAVDNNDTYPDPGEVSPEGAVGRYVDSWPLNPWTGEPMRNTAARGDFTYTLDGDGMFVDYSLSGNLSDGSTYTIH
jgi:type II secretory pathway pseudopilin PulG